VTQEPLPHALHKRGRRLDNGLWEVRGWLSDDLPDGAEVDGDPGADWIPVWTAEATDRGLIQISFDRFTLEPGLNVWFVFVDEPKANPPAANLVAFIGDQRPMGTVVSRYSFATMGVSNDEQAGAVRWYTDGGLVHQIYIGPKHRRHHLATYLLYSANALHHSNGWNGLLHGDGRRTLLGELLVAASSYPARYRALELEMPAMDPTAD
jgi:hypothetical protein